MKKQPKAVYIIENGGYTELTYEEFCRREQICPLYADKLFLPLYGRLMEVSKEDYAEFYRAKRRQKYLDERSADNGDFSYDMLTTDEFSGEDILIAEQREPFTNKNQRLPARSRNKKTVYTYRSPPWDCGIFLFDIFYHFSSLLYFV